MQSPTESTVLKGYQIAKEMLKQSLGDFDAGKLFLGPDCKPACKLADYTGPIKIVSLLGESFAKAPACNSLCHEVFTFIDNAIFNSYTACLHALKATFSMLTACHLTTYEQTVSKVRFAE